MQEQKSFTGSIMILLASIMGSFLTVTLLMPKFFNWYSSPFMPQGVSCAPAIQWAVDKMIWLQMVSMIIGAVLGLVVVFKLRKKNSN